MSAHESIVAIDVGAASLKVGEFVVHKGSSLEMTQFGFAEYPAGTQDDNRFQEIENTLRSIKESKSITGKVAHVAISVQMAFTKFVKLPPVVGDAEKLRQVIEFEAKQNVPFDLNEVIWDYQIIGNSGEELNVMFVAVKKDIADSISQAIENCGFKIGVIEIATTACYNAAQVNRIGREECAMVLSIGARSSNLIFCDGDRFFSRNIPIAGVAIAQQIGKEFGIGVDEAEELKRRHGFVALGGAYEEPESEVAATISKIVRNVMTRLHSEISRSINIYKSQQKGNKPSTLYLCGGSSTMLFTETFFEEKLKCNVEYLNPFQSSLRLGDAIDRQQLAEKAHLFSEVVGLALRVAECPVEVSLMPERLKRALEGRQKLPYFIAAAASILLIPVAMMAASKHKNDFYTAEKKERDADVKKYLKSISNIKADLKAYEKIKAKNEELNQLEYQRKKWADALNELQLYTPENIWLKSLKAGYGKAKVIEAGTTEATPTQEVAPKKNEKLPWGQKRAQQKRDAQNANMKATVAAKDIGYLDVEAFWLRIQKDGTHPMVTFKTRYDEGLVFYNGETDMTGIIDQKPSKYKTFGYFKAQMALLKEIKAGTSK